MITYDEIELDSISEIINIGINRSAAALGELTEHEVMLSVPILSIINAIDLVSELCASTDSVCGIFKRIIKPLESYAVVIIPMRSRDDIVRFMLPQYLSRGQAESDYDDAVTEIGNIMIGACLSSIADTLDIDIDLDQPVIHVEHPSEFFLTSIVVNDLCEYFLDVKIDMTVRDTPLAISWEFLLPDNAFEVIKEQMRRLGRVSAIGT
ncbi:MAG: chemotaxis protein CheC [Rhodospirillaceae bacterium]